jgi:hypothetical protein
LNLYIANFINNWRWFDIYYTDVILYVHLDNLCQVHTSIIYFMPQLSLQRNIVHFMTLRVRAHWTWGCLLYRSLIMYMYCKVSTLYIQSKLSFTISILLQQIYYTFPNLFATDWFSNPTRFKWTNHTKAKKKKKNRKCNLQPNDVAMRSLVS